MYNVTQARSRIFAVEKQYYIFVCVRARAYVRACAREHVALLIQHATCMRHVVTSFVAPLAPPHFSILSYKRCDFRKNVIEHKTCVLILSTTSV